MIVILAVILASFVPSAYAEDTQAPLVLPDLISFSGGIGSVCRTGQETSVDFDIYSYQCQTNHVETVVQEYIRELRKFGIYISQSERTVYDSATNDANYGIALCDTNRDQAKFFHENIHGWSFHNVSIYIAFSTGGHYDTQYISISYAKGCYRIANTGAKIRTDRSFHPDDYYFYRNQLKSDAQKAAYDYILKKVETMETPISLAGLPARMNYDEFFLVWYSVLIDNPQLFTVDDNQIGEIKYNNDGTVRSFTVYYYEAKKDLPSMKKAYEEAIADALSVIDPYMTDYQKELALHDWLCKHIRYDHRTNHYKSTCSYSAIVKGLAVCEGYSEAFTELLHRVGIDAATVYGFVLPEEDPENNGHAWNIVCINGNWYYVDVTWDDEPQLRYDYFNLTTAQMALDHKNGIGTFPLCNSRDAAYRKSN